MIRLLVLDVDGTLTDGGIYYDSHGNELKKFAAKDGAGLLIARAAGIRVMICTGRECEAVRRRAADLKITDVYQNVGRKAEFLRDFFCTERLQQRGNCLLRRRCERPYRHEAVRFCCLPGRCHRPDSGTSELHLYPPGRRRCRTGSGTENLGDGRTLEGGLAGSLWR